MSDYIPREIEIRDKAQGRIIWQYRNSPKFKSWVDALPKIGDAQIGESARAVARLINIDTATGEALNICGRIVQIDRPVIPEPQLADVAHMAALNDDPPQMGEYDAQLMSLEYSIPLELQDDLYRGLIRSKIAVNTSDVTIDELSRILAYAAGVEPEAVKIVDYQDMTFSVTFGVTISEITRYIFSNYPFVPRPQGVKLLGYVEQPLFMQMNNEGEFSMGSELAQLGNLEEVFT